MKERYNGCLMNVYSTISGYRRLANIPVLSRKARQRLKWFDYYNSLSDNARLTYRYFGDWKKLPQNLGVRYHIAKAALKNHPEFSGTMIESVATYLGRSEEEVIVRLEKPWGLKQLLMGEWPNYAKEKRKSERESRLQDALKLIALIEHSEMTPKEITAVFNTLIREAQKRKAAQRD